MNDICRALPLGKQVMMEQRTQLSTPASVAPHPLLRHLTYPSLKLLLHLGRDPFHVFGVIATARNLELFPIDLKAALFAEAQTTAHPNARTHAASNDSWHAHGGRWASKERDRQTRSVVQVADEAEPPALAYKVHDQPSGVLTFRTAAPPTEQPSGIESSSSLAQIEVNVGGFDGAIDCGRIIAGDRERPDRQLPIARVQGYADCRTKFRGSPTSQARYPDAPGHFSQGKRLLGSQALVDGANCAEQSPAKPFPRYWRPRQWVPR